MLHRRHLLLLTALFVACAGADDGVTECRDRKGIHPVCGFQNPEDLAVPGDGSPLIVSEAGSMLDESRRGRISLFDLKSERRHVVYPGNGPRRASGAPGWGDPACPGEPHTDLNPHGIDLARRPDGRLRLLVVNHGGRESIEIFEVTGSGDALEVHWRGCAIPPDGLFFNDVVNLPDGGFLATHMMRGNPIWGVLRSRMGFDTGAVYEWQAPDSWKVVPGTEAPFPNGIEVSGDAREIFLNVYSAGEVRRISREMGEILAMASIPSPDNSSWSQDGRLLVASHVGGFADEVKCWDLEKGVCPMAFDIVSLDPVTLEGRVIFSNAGEPMGGGTIAVDLGNELVIGSFAGDRILRFAR
jgi:sugar lactone lactonase YvrE